MRVPRIYTELPLTEGKTIQLDKSTSSYLTRVLRLQADATLHLFNGQTVSGEFGYYAARITSAGKQVEVTVDQFIAESNSSSLKITLFQGISKGDHMDITIQKAVELGVTEIIPVICERTVVNLKADRLDKKMKHWNGIMTSACEQSGRNQLLTVHAPVTFETITLETEKGFILQPETSSALKDESPADSVSLLIGPEGGFTEIEVNNAIEKGFTAVRFGPRILRTETAAIAAISIIQSQWGDLN